MSQYRQGCAEGLKKKRAPEREISRSQREGEVFKLQCKQTRKDEGVAKSGGVSSKEWGGLQKKFAIFSVGIHSTPMASSYHVEMKVRYVCPGEGIGERITRGRISNGAPGGLWEKVLKL